METTCKRKLRKLFKKYWSQTNEIRSGSSFGAPDLQFLVNGMLLPVEVKRGVADFVSIGCGVIFPEVIRPSQISWHHEFLMAGGKSFIVVCYVHERIMDAWALPSVHRDVTSQWNEGFLLADCTQWVKDGKAVIELADLLVENKIEKN